MALSELIDELTLLEACTTTSDFIAHVAGLIEARDREIARLSNRVSDLTWATNPDRMGGGFSEDEVYPEWK